ncbi:MAG: serine/threonine protein kinase [Planctomycetota bacterium]|nr:MAG: serine/threonine protein kinase [Planctomycetota bacterium]
MPLRQDDAPEVFAEEAPGPRQGSRAGETVQLGAEFLRYARERFDAPRFKDELVRRLLPTVPRGGRPRPVRPGQSFGKFEILEKLGRGGMASVYRALDPERDAGGAVGAHARAAQSVALKVMKPEIAHDPDYVRRFLREAANTALIEHPNVVRVHEVGSVAGRLYFTMELIEGVTLKEHLKTHRLSEHDGVQILCQLVDGLRAAHERGVGHRDLKPSNLMLLTSETRYGFGLRGEFDVVVKVTDFGLSQMLDTDRSDIMPGGRFLGTAKYVAPEVIKGAAPTLKSDVFSLGIMAFTMFAGRSPFAARNKVEYIAANLQAEAPLLDTMADVSPELSRLVDRMLHKDPEERPDAGALRRDLERLRQRADPGEPIDVYDDPTSVYYVGAARAAGGWELSPSLMAAAAGALLVALLVIWAFAVGGDGPDLGGAPGGGPSAEDALSPRNVRLPEDRPPRDPSHGPARGNEPGTPSRQRPPAGGGASGSARLLAPVTPPRTDFADALARTQFRRHLQAGDAAWSAGEAREALERWEAAVARLRGRVPAALARRLAVARERVALADGQAAEAGSQFVRAERIYRRALEAGAPADELKARLARVEGLARQEAQFVRAVRRARARAQLPSRRAEALQALEALRPLADTLGRGAELERAIAEARSRGEDASPGAAEDAGEIARRIAEELERGALEAAARLIERLARDPTATERVEVLRERLRRRREAPAGYRLVERAGERPGDAGRALYVSAQPVSNRDYARWFAEASRQETMPPPAGWRGAFAPPPGEEDAPVRGVRRAQAARYARAQGGRLPSEADLALLDAQVQGALRPDPGGVYADGFRVVRDP